MHRLGQTKPVRVINLVAKDSIEHRILGLLGSKRALAAGILDAGADTVDLGGNRMKRFMAEVEAATSDGATSTTPTSSITVQSGPSPALVRAASTPTAKVKAPVLSASIVAARVAELVGVQSSALTVQMGSDGQATITLTPALLAKLGLMT